MRSRFVFFAYLCLVSFLGLLVACGGASSNNNLSSNNNPSPGTTGPSSPGSSSPGSGGGSGSGTGSSSSFVSYAYTAGTSAIKGYGVKADGSLTPLSGSPYAASAGLNASNIVTNGANLYAIAADFRNLDVFSIDKASGALTFANTMSPLTGDPHQGDIALSPALDHTRTSLYVTLGLSDFDSGINVFTVGSSPNAQQIQFLPGPAIALPAPVFSPNNQFAYTSFCEVRINGVFGYARASDGTLKGMNPGLPQPPTIPGEGFCPQSVAASAKGYLAIAWPHFDFASSNPGNETFVKTYTINADGTLTAVSNSQVLTASSKANKTVLNFDPTGSFLAAAGDGGVQTFALNSNGTLAPIGSSQAAGVKFQSVAWDNANNVFATSSDQLYVFNSSTGALAPVPGSPYPGDPALTVLPLQ